MSSFRFTTTLLAAGALLGLSLISSAGSGAQSPTCAKASAARAAKSKDYPRLQQACISESRKSGHPKRTKQKQATPPQSAPSHHADSSPRPSKHRKSLGGLPWMKLQTGGNQPAPTERSNPARAPRRAAPAPAYPTNAVAQSPAAPAPAQPPEAAPARPAGPSSPAAPAAMSPVAPLTATEAPLNSPAAEQAPAKANRVLGLRLGEALGVPTCGADAGRDSEVLQSLTAPGTTPRRTNASCLFTPDAMNGKARVFAQRLANVTVSPLPAGVDFSLVAIASNRCPDWVNAAGSCVAGVTTKDGRIIGISYLAGEDKLEAGIEKSLSETYAATPRAQAAAPCQDPKLGARASTNRVWQSAGLQVSYFPTGGLSCRQGRVLVETDTMRQLLAAPLDKRQANEQR